jgi:sec-independent protein translocase protein TatC
MAQKRNKDEMTFMDHLEDLRWHVIRSVLVILALSVFFLIYPQFIFDRIILAPKDPDFITYRIFCSLGHWLNTDALCIKVLDYKLFYLNLSSPFLLYLKIAIMGGVIFAFPYILWEVWRFVRPALYQNEIRNLGGLVLISTLLFYVGAFFGYFLLAPFSINFLATFTLSSQIENQFTFDSYLGILTGMILWTGLIFEIPMIAYFLAKLGLLGKQFLARNRKYAFVISLIMAAIITPSGDIFSLFLVSLPLWVLYEVSIMVVRVVEKRREKDKPAAS